MGALEQGDLVALGAVLDESHASLRDSYEVSTPAIERAVERLHDAGAIGARIIGGGFGGHVLGLLPPDGAKPADAVEVRPGPGARCWKGQRAGRLTSSGVSAVDVIAVARRDAAVALTAEARAAMERSAAVVEPLTDAEEPAYGVSTGFGSLATVRIPADRRDELQRALVRSHATGMGPPVEREVVRAMMLLRARYARDGLVGRAAGGR